VELAMTCDSHKKNHLPLHRLRISRKHGSTLLVQP